MEIRLKEPKSKILRGLRMVKENHGGSLMAEDVRNDAMSDTKHPLHQCFEYSKDKAWEAYNLEIARSLIRMFRLEMIDPKIGKVIEAPIFINFHNLEGQKGPTEYYELQDVLKSKSKMELALETGVGEILGTIRRWLWHDRLGPLCRKFEKELLAMKDDQDSVGKVSRG